MAYPFPIQRYREFQNWIPESDADGIDSKEEFIADCENIDFENGFISSARKPLSISLPLAVQTVIDSGYELLDSKFFTHSERDDIEFYILYKYESPNHRLRFFVTDYSGTKELNIDYQNSDVTIKTKPTLITYSLMQNQLKVNLNVVGTYNALTQDVYLNLTLAYIDGRFGYVGLSNAKIGWYLFPRWLGWSYNSATTSLLHSNTVPDNILDMEGSLTHNANTETVTTKNCALDSGTQIAPNGNDSCQMTASYDNSSGEITEAYYLIELTEIVSKVKFYYNTWTEGISSDDVKNFLRFVALDENDDVLITIPMSISYGDNTYYIEDDHLLLKAKKIKILLNPAHYDGTTTQVNIDDIELTYKGRAYVLLGKQLDQQRGMLEYGDNEFGLGSSLRIPKTMADFRITNYELYVKKKVGINDSEGYIYYKWLDVPANSGNWSDGGTYYEYIPNSNDFIDLTKPGIESLNLNYGLGKSIKAFGGTPDNNTLVIGNLIYREALYRGRNYYVTYDENLYYSHISGTGLPQPDSFPSLNNKPIGYILISNQSKCVGVAITSLNELLVQTDDRAFMYQMEYSGGTFFRKRRVINGAFGLGAVNSLVTNLDGTPKDVVMFWTNKWGAYIYGGGINAPKDIVYSTHKNYWRDLTTATKAEILSFYNPRRREYWSVLDDKTILVYEIPTNSFRKYKFDFAIKSYIGEKNKIAYVLGDDNKIYKLDPEANSYLDGYIVTHYNTNTIIIGQYPISSWEFQHKIMQDIYVAFKDSVSGLVKYTIYTDDHIIEPSGIVFTSGRTLEVLPSPLLVRYGKAKIKLDKKGNSAKIKEFGYSFNLVSQGFGNRGANIKTISGLGLSSGTQAGVGL